MYASYCKIWKLEINSSKTKVLIFSKGRLPNYVFTIDGLSWEGVKDYKYLGVIFSRGGSFLPMKKHCQASNQSYVLSFEKSQIIIITHWHPVRIMQ